jgi:hypothetical protein
MSKQKWFSGPPPSIGWWPASVVEDDSALRWWNGEFWSQSAYEESPPWHAAFLAEQFSSNQEAIQWTHRPASWPKRSRT